MAARFFVNGGVDNNWSSISNWSLTSGGAGGQTVPTAADDVTFDASSPNCTINTSARVAKTLTCTAYVNTLTFSQQLTVSGSITLGAGMTFAGTAALLVNATGTITSNGKTINIPFTFSNATQTATLADAMVVTGLLTFAPGSFQTITINGFSVSAGGSVTHSGSGITGGTTILILNGTGTFTGGSVFRNPITINTAGTITLSGTILYSQSSSTFTYTAGTVISTGAILHVMAAATLDLGSLVLETLMLSGSATITLSSAITVTNLTLATGTSHVTTINGHSININGNLSVGSASNSVCNGTTNMVLAGTGIWSTSTSTPTLRNNLTINTAGTITISGTVYYNSGVLTYTAGTVVVTGSTLAILSATTLNVAGITWNNVIFQNGIVTLSANLDVNGTLYLQPSTSATLTINGFSILVGGDLVVQGAFNAWVNGTTVLLIDGTGTWSQTNTTQLRSPLTINTAGTFTISGVVYYSAATMTYTAGTLAASTGIIRVTSDTTTVLNLAGQTIGGLSVIPTGVTVQVNLASGLVISGSLTLTGANSGVLAGVRSNASPTQRALTVLAGAAVDVGYAAAIDIDSSAGEQVKHYKGTTSNTLNWSPFTPYTAGSLGSGGSATAYGFMG
jgi:hypothetical protein